MKISSTLAILCAAEATLAYNLLGSVHIFGRTTNGTIGTANGTTSTNGTSTNGTTPTNSTSLFATPVIQLSSGATLFPNSTTSNTKASSTAHGGGSELPGSSSVAETSASTSAAKSSSTSSSKADARKLAGNSVFAIIAAVLI